MAKARPQLDKMANGKKKPMSRTSGVARRLTKRDEGIATKLKYGAPLTGSASGVKSISLKDAGEVLTQGIVTLGKKGLKADPASLAMALPVGKLVKAAKALRLIGKSGPVGPLMQAAALEARVLAKQAGRELGPQAVKNLGPKTLPPVGPTFRKTSESVFPRLPKKSPTGKPDLGDLAAKETPFMTPQLYRRYVKKVQKAAEGTRVTELEKRLKLPKGRGK
jgi:hypothetical protein